MEGPLSPTDCSLAILVFCTFIGALGVWPQVEERLLASFRSTSLALTMPSGSMDGTIIYLIDFTIVLPIILFFEG